MGMQMRLQRMMQKMLLLRLLRLKL